MIFRQKTTNNRIMSEFVIFPVKIIKRKNINIKPEIKQDIL